MSKKDKNYSKLCDKPRPSGIKFRDVKTLLEQHGYTHVPERAKGGHFFFIHDNDEPLIFAEKKGEIKPQYINMICQRIKERNHE